MTYKIDENGFKKFKHTPPSYPPIINGIGEKNNYRVIYLENIISINRGQTKFVSRGAFFWCHVRRRGRFVSMHRLTLAPKKGRNGMDCF